MSLRIVITVKDATLPEEQRQVLLTGLAAELADQLALLYNGIGIVIEDAFAETPGSSSILTHEINTPVYNAYFPVYGGS